MPVVILRMDRMRRFDQAGTPTDEPLRAPVIVQASVTDSELIQLRQAGIHAAVTLAGSVQGHIPGVGAAGIEPA